MRAEADVNVKAPEVLVDVRHGGNSGHGPTDTRLLEQSPLSTIWSPFMHLQKVILVSIETPHDCGPHWPYGWHVGTLAANIGKPMEAGTQPGLQLFPQVVR